MIARYCSAFGTSLALHVCFGLAAIWLAAHATYGAAARRPRSQPTVVVFQASDFPSGAPAGSEPGDMPDDLIVEVEGDASSLDVNGFAFDFRKVIARAGALFPFLTDRIGMEQLVPQPADHDRGPSLSSPFAVPARIDPGGQPLVMTDEALQQLIDKSWSRKERWREFAAIRALADLHGATDGRLPDVLREYTRQNGLQPYVDRYTRDPRVWTQLGLAADHTDFIAYARQYAAKHPSTRATTELLFLLEKMAQGSFDALTLLLDVDPVRQLRSTREANVEAWSALVRMRDYYRAQVERRALWTRGDLRAHYADVRLRILGNIIRTTPHGYRAGDARYLAGAIHWEQGRTGQAIQSWSEITFDARDVYAPVYNEILDAIARRQPPDVQQREIARILDAERERWVSFSADRLQRFGYRLDSY